ncbi:MAG: hypothetical protein DMG39_16405 [Acidobacteria bacterium]|nr:MAG: hypothetical protein DMG39_16405 [Acidobacteriota bacterium]
MLLSTLGKLMTEKKRGFTYSLVDQIRLHSRVLAVVLLFLTGILLCLTLSGCAAYTTVNTQSTGSKTLSSTPASIDFGNVSVGSNATQSVTLTNSGTAMVTVSQAKISGSAFAVTQGTPLSSIPAGQSASLQIRFAPSSAGNLTGSLTVTSNASNSPTTVALSGTGAAVTSQLSATPSSLSFGSVNVGASSFLGLALKNSGNSNVTISGVTTTGSGYGASGVAANTTLTPGQTATLNVTFAPTAAGNVAGSVSVTSDAGNSPATIALSGTGAAVTSQLSATPSSLSFGSVNLGGGSSLGVTLTNNGNSNVTISSVSTSGTGYSTSGVSANATLTPGQTATLNVTFAPTAAGNVTGTVSVSSNASNSPTTIALSGTGAAVTSQLTATPTSLSFGSVNEGASSSLGVTLTNSGNSDVTISDVSTSGAGYSASGVSANATLTPGQTATLNVTFAPTAAGSVAGSVAATSNAGNSPTTISLSGSGLAQSASGAPSCGKSGDSSNHVPTDWNTFVPPGKGQSYVDPTFGCTVTRITDVSSEVWSGSFYLPITHGYATVSPFNANDTYLMLADGWNRHFVTDLKGNMVVASGNMPGMNDTWVLWDATNVSVFYYTNGNSLMKGTISASAVAASTVHQFSEYAAINFMDETDVSQDGAHVVIVGGDTSGSSPENVFDYDFVTNTKGPVYTTSCRGPVGGPNNACLHKLIQTPDNNVIVQFASDGSGPEQGNRLWTGSSPLLVLQDATNHLDGGMDLSGNAVFIESGNGTYTPGLSNPCPSGWGLDVRQIYNPASAVCLLDNPPSWHVGYRGNAQQPWVGLSFFDVRSSGPEWFDNSANYAAPSSSTWLLYEDEIMAVRIDANNNANSVYRLARGYSRSNEDFNATPKAAISRDGKYLAFDSNMAYAHSGCPANFQTATNCIDVYVIKIK